MCKLWQCRQWREKLRKCSSAFVLEAESRYPLDHTNKLAHLLRDTLHLWRSVQILPHKRRTSQPEDTQSYSTKKLICLEIDLGLACKARLDCIALALRDGHWGQNGTAPSLTRLDNNCDKKPHTHERAHPCDD